MVVGFGRRQVLGIVLGEAHEPPGVETRPVLARVRADGPLLPSLTLRLARWVSTTYLAPAALVLRSFLPPGMLERFELVAELRPAARAARPSLDAQLELVPQLPVAKPGFLYLWAPGAP